MSTNFDGIVGLAVRGPRRFYLDRNLRLALQTPLVRVPVDVISSLLSITPQASAAGVAGRSFVAGAAGRHGHSPCSGPTLARRQCHPDRRPCRARFHTAGQAHPLHVPIAARCSCTGSRTVTLTAPPAKS